MYVVVQHICHFHPLKFIWGSWVMESSHICILNIHHWIQGLWYFVFLCGFGSLIHIHLTFFFLLHFRRRSSSSYLRRRLRICWSVVHMGQSWMRKTKGQNSAKKISTKFSNGGQRPSLLSLRDEDPHLQRWVKKIEMTSWTQSTELTVWSFFFWVEWSSHTWLETNVMRLWNDFHAHFQASFVASGNRTDISLDDPNFWDKWAKKADIDMEMVNGRVRSFKHCSYLYCSCLFLQSCWEVICFLFAFHRTAWWLTPRVLGSRQGRSAPRRMSWQNFQRAKVMEMRQSLNSGETMSASTVMDARNASEWRRTCSFMGETIEMVWKCSNWKLSLTWDGIQTCLFIFNSSPSEPVHIISSLEIITTQLEIIDLFGC